VIGVSLGLPPCWAEEDHQATVELRRIQKRGSLP
jgi:hypothetical protein